MVAYTVISNANPTAVHWFVECSGYHPEMMKEDTLYSSVICDDVAVLVVRDFMKLDVAQSQLRTAVAHNLEYKKDKGPMRTDSVDPQTWDAGHRVHTVAVAAAKAQVVSLKAMASRPHHSDALLPATAVPTSLSDSKGGAGGFGFARIARPVECPEAPAAIPAKNSRRKTVASTAVEGRAKSKEARRVKP
jgi:hypothetical protein